LIGGAVAAGIALIAAAKIWERAENEKLDRLESMPPVPSPRSTLSN
jgi:hypothetical protein